MEPNAVKDQINKQPRDIRLIDMLIFVLKYKRLFIFCLLFAGIVTPLYLFLNASKTPSVVSLPRTYYHSQCSISAYNDRESASNRVDNLRTILQSRDLTLQQARENKLPMIRQKIWDEKKDKWVTERLYIWDESGGTLVESPANNTAIPEEVATLYIKTQYNVLTIGFSSADREKTIKVMDEYLKYISEYYRQRDMAMIEAQKKLYQKQLLNYRLLERLIELNDRDFRAKNDRYYGYDIMDSPSITEIKPQRQITKGSGMKRYIMMTLLLMMAAFAVALTIAGAMEYLSLIKKNDPEGFNALLNYLRLKKRDRRVDSDESPKG